MMERKKKKNPSSSEVYHITDDLIIEIDECKEMDKIVVNKSEVYHISDDDDMIIEIDECKEMDKLIVVNNKSEVYHISDDLIIEILVRLPPRSIVRFKQVCKTWYSLITNHGFLRSHYLYQQFHKHTSTTTIDDHEELMVSSYNFRGFPLELQINQLLKLIPTSSKLDTKLLDSCNGLTLLRCHDTERSDSYDYYVCNPVIKHLFKIPTNRITEKLSFLEPPTNYILFDPSIKTLSYKLIRCFTRRDRNFDVLCDFYVYSSDIGSWRHLVSFPSSETGLRSQHDTGVLLNGIFYWKEIYNGDRLVCFDLKEENGWFLPLPPNPIGYSERICFYFGECDGRLRLIEKCFFSQGQGSSHLTIPCSFDIMETKPQQQQDGNQLTWIVKYHVNINTAGYVENQLASTFRIIQLYKTKKNEDALLLNIHGTIVPFNLKNNTFGKKLRMDKKTSIFSDLSDFSNVFPYIKTTLLPLL